MENVRTDFPWVCIKTDRHWLVLTLEKVLTDFRWVCIKTDHTYSELNKTFWQTFDESALKQNIQTRTHLRHATKSWRLCQCQMLIWQYLPGLICIWIDKADLNWTWVWIDKVRDQQQSKKKMVLKRKRSGALNMEVKKTVI